MGKHLSAGQVVVRKVKAEACGEFSHYGTPTTRGGANAARDRRYRNHSGRRSRQSRYQPRDALSRNMSPPLTQRKQASVPRAGKTFPSNFLR